MTKIIIYTTDICPYCTRAKDLLASKGLKYQEINVTNNPKEGAEMVKKSNGRKTVPQIFFDDRHIGGYDDLYALNNSGELDEIKTK